MRLIAIFLTLAAPIVLGAAGNKAQENEDGSFLEEVSMALRKGDIPAAWDQFLTALDSEWDSYDTSDKLDVLDLGAEMCLASGDPYLGLVILSTVPDSALADNQEAAYNFHIREVELLLKAGRLGEGESRLNELLDGLDAESNPELLYRLFAQHAVFSWLAHREAEADSYAEHILSTHAQVDPYSKAIAYMIHALVMDEGDVSGEDVVHQLQLSKELFKQHSIPTKFYSLLTGFVYRHEEFSFDRTSSVLLEVMQDGMESECSRVRAIALAAKGELLHRSGQLEGAFKAIEESHVLLQRSEEEQNSNIARLNAQLNVFEQSGSFFNPYTVIFLLLCTLLVLVLSLRIQTQRIVNERLRDSVEKSRVAEESAAHANQLKSQFVSNVSHELKTPMSGLVGMASILDELITDPVQRKYLGTIRACASNLLVMLNDLLDLGRMESGRLEIDRKSFPLGDVLDYCEQVVSLEVKKKKLELVVQTDPSVPERIISDPTRLGQILINLLNNAIKYTEKGSVSLAISFRHTLGDVGQLEACVKDTGRGIAPKHLGTVFEPFNQGDPGPESESAGTGLGLAISSKLAELMGGVVSVTSEIGKGSEFTLILPVRIPPAGSSTD